MGSASWFQQLHFLPYHMCMAGRAVLGSGVRSQWCHYYLPVQEKPGIVRPGFSCTSKLKAGIQPCIPDQQSSDCQLSPDNPVPDLELFERGLTISWLSVLVKKPQVWFKTQCCPGTGTNSEIIVSRVEGNQDSSFAPSLASLCLHLRSYIRVTIRKWKGWELANNAIVTWMISPADVAGKQTMWSVLSLCRFVPLQVCFQAFS